MGGEASTGVWSPLSGEIAPSLFLFSPNAPIAVDMPLALTGTIEAGVLRLRGDNGAPPDAGVAADFTADAFRCREEVYFSTEFGFTSGAVRGVSVCVRRGSVG